LSEKTFKSNKRHNREKWQSQIPFHADFKLLFISDLRSTEDDLQLY